jgi:acetaldehyde dehydrogenase (acetylating)
MIGYTTGIRPSLTLGSGGVGGSITGDNITVHHLFNVKRLVYETSSPPPEAFLPGRVGIGVVNAPNPAELEKIVREVVAEILKAD